MLGHDGRPISVAATGKSLALLCYLVLRGAATREEVLALLWGDMDEARARNACRQALHRLRRCAPGLLVSEDGMLRIDSGRVLCDVLAFQEALGAQEFEQAAHIYAGDLLSGEEVQESSFVHWCGIERERLRTLYHSALLQVAEEAIVTGRLDVALRWSHAYRSSAPADPAAALLEARALASAGRREEAAASLKTYSDHLQREYELPEPLPITEARARLTTRTAWDSPAADPVAPLPSQDLFLGRQAELAALFERWRMCCHGTGGVVSILGPAGAGKTRLAGEFVARASGTGPGIFVWGTEHPVGAALPYAGIAEALRGLLRAPGIAGASEHLLAEAARVLPELRDRFRLPAPVPATDEAAKLRLFEGLAALVDAVAFEQPVCIVLERAERSSPATLDLLRYLLLRLSGSAVLFVLIVDDGGAEWTARFVLESGLNCTVLQLPPLAQDELDSLVARVGNGLPVNQRQRVVALSEGLPGRLIELCLRHAEGRPLVAPLVEMSVVLSTRLASCSGSEKRLFAAAALIGRGAPVRLLAAAAHVPEAAALHAAISLKRLGLYEECGLGYEIASGCSLETARVALGDAPLVLLAGWTAEALEHQRAGSYGEIARLFKLAARSTDALHALRRGADDALNVGAIDEACVLLEEALLLAQDRQQRAGIELLLRALRRQGKKRLGPALPTGQPFVRRLSRRLGLAAAAATVFMAAAAFLIFGQIRGAAMSTPTLADTLLLNTEGNDRFANYAVTGTGSMRPYNAPAARVHLPWANPVVSPVGNVIALERLRPGGTDIYLVTAAADTLPFIVGGGDDFVLGWSPDGAWLLVSRTGSADASGLDTDLYAYELNGNRAVVAIDTLSDRRVLEAAWSPLGNSIAWVAQVASGARELFTSAPDGTGGQTIGAGAEAYHLAWAPDAMRIGFTTKHYGNPEIAMVDLATLKLWRLTFNDGTDDYVHFSPDGRYAAFQSLRNNEPGIYLIRSWGGKPAKIAGTDAQTAIVGWKGSREPYAANLFLEQRPLNATTALISAQVLTRQREALSTSVPVSFRIVPESPGRIEPTSRAGTVQVVAPAGSVVEVIASMAGWLSDTAFVVFSAAGAPAFKETFQRELELNWLPLGRRWAQVGRTATGARQLSLSASGDWETGVLSRRRFPIQPGMVFTSAIDARGLTPMAGRAIVSLVAPETTEVYDEARPQFLRLVSVQWLAGGSRIAYSVHREMWTESASEIAGTGRHTVRMRVANDGTVEFLVDERLRWRSTVRLQDDYGGAGIWLAASGAGSSTAFNEVSIRYDR